MDLLLELKILVRRMRPGLVGPTRNPNRNLKQILEELKRKPKYVEQLRAHFEEMLLKRDFVVALTESGLSQHTGVFLEIFKRLEYKILPKAQEPNDILVLVDELFGASSDADWFLELDDSLLVEFLAQILPTRAKMADRLIPQLFYSLEILSLRLASLGLESVVKQRLKERTDLQHCFVEVPRTVQKILESQGQSSVLFQQLQMADQAVGYIRSRRDKEGISLGLTFRLQRIQELTKRLRLILKIIDTALEEGDGAPALDLFRQIVAAQIEHFNIGQYLGRNMALLAFQITEHTGKTGEHYVTSSRSEYFEMFRSATIGGGIVAVLAILKILASYLHLAPLPEAVLYGILYSVGFIVIISIGGVLATKQPAMTAAYLANALDGAKSSTQALQDLVEVIVRTIRSQMIALMGNYLIAFPIAASFCFLLFYSGHPLMNPEKIKSTLESIHPWQSLALMYAAMAGLCLFVSGLLAGFASNWFHFNKVGERLKHSPLLAWFLKHGNFDPAIRSIESNIGSWTGNISLGFFLGTMPALGIIFGLPLGVMHVTFTSATFGAIAGSAGFQVTVQDAVWIAVGTLVYGLINLAVSFSLSLLVAVQSRGIRFSGRRELLGLLGRRLLKRPWDFFWPPKAALPAAGHAE